MTTGGGGQLSTSWRAFSCQICNKSGNIKKFKVKRAEPVVCKFVTLCQSQPMVSYTTKERRLKSSGCYAIQFMHNQFKNLRNYNACHQLSILGFRTSVMRQATLEAEASKRRLRPSAGSPSAFADSEHRLYRRRHGAVA
jgi:hypothetical protein